MVSSANCDHVHSIDVAWGLPRIGKTKTASIVLAASLQSKVGHLCALPMSYVGNNNACLWENSRRLEVMQEP